MPLNPVLKTHLNITQQDDIYAAILDAHDGLTKAQSDGLNARLILILINHIGDRTVIEEALHLARQTELTRSSA